MFRDPTGASRVGSPVCLTLLLERDTELSSERSVILHLRFDKDGSQDRIPMKRSSSFTGSDRYDAWTAEAELPAKGLYWYWFELTGAGSPGPEGSGRIGLDPYSGQAIFSEESDAWQITAYEPAFADPDWIRGGVIYLC